jgi:hypothetical protein
VETGLLRDGDWAPLDGQVCRVTSLTPLGFTKRMPYASIALESPLLPKPTTGFVTHKLDFEHLSEAFRLKENEPDAEVLIIWTKQFLKRSARLLSRAMPHMWVMLCRMNQDELLDSLEQAALQNSIAEWKPDVMQ